jgi:peptide/nickel transport system substrate-binding protein
VVKDALAHHRGQIAFVPGGAYRYVAINTTIKPFDNLDVRKAVVAAADRRALQLSRGGEAAGRLATHFLPLDFPGHAEGGGDKGTGADFLSIRAGIWTWPGATCSRPGARTRACRSIPTGAGPAAGRC